MIACRVCDAAAKEGIPLVADVIQSMYGPTNIEVLHYDYATDLTLQELQFIQRMVKIAARYERHIAEYTLTPLRFSFRKRPTRGDWDPLEVQTPAVETAEAFKEPEDYHDTLKAIAALEGRKANAATIAKKMVGGVTPLSSVAQLTPPD